MNSEVLLKNKKQFQEILANYRVSQHAQKILHKVNYVVLVGVAGAGRNTVISELVKGGKYQQVVSDTTRPPKMRDGKMEQNGVNYYFRSEEDILEDLQNGEYLEAELIHNQQVSGTSIRELEAIDKAGKIGINEVEFGGSINILNAKENSTVIALLPPSYEEWIRRLEARETMSERELLNRINTAKSVINHILSEKRISIVINHNYRECAHTVDKIVNGNRQSPAELQEATAVARNILTKIEEILKV